MAPLLALLLLAGGTALAYVGTRRRRWAVPGAALAAAGATAWLLDNGRYEGAVLLTVSPSHGLTAADLLAVPAGALLVRLSWPPARR